MIFYNKVRRLDEGRQVEFTDDVAGCCDRYEAFPSQPTTHVNFAILTCIIFQKASWRR